MRLLPATLRRLEPFLPFGAAEFWLREWGHAPDGVVPMRAVARETRGRDTVLRLRPRAGRKPVFAAGQHLTLVARIEGVSTRRSYSPVSAPAADGSLTLSMRRVPGGRMSDHLATTPLADLHLELEPAFGPQRADETLWLAAGSGVTPFVALAEALVAGAGPGTARLVLWERHAADAGQAPRLAELARASQGRLVFELVETARQGRLDAAQWARLGLDGVPARACGPQGFVDTVQALAGAHLRHAEGFSPRPVPVEADAPATVPVRLARSGRTLQVSTAQPLLPALEAAGVFPAHGCRQGLCNRCACGAQGAVRHLVTGEAFDADAPVRLCVTRALGPLALDL